MDVFSEIKKILMEILDLEGREITPESYLMRDLGAESIDLLELSAALNEIFKIEVREEDIFLKGTRSRLRTEEIPFLTEQRAGEIAADLECAPVVKVKDIVSYVTWQLLEMKRSLT